MEKSFKHLAVWQEGHQLVLLTYKLSRSFPKEEQFGLTSQMRRAAVSITSNIAEGYGRKSHKDKEHFYVMATGSLYELQSQLEVANDLKYLDSDLYSQMVNRAETVAKLLNGLLRAHANSKF